MVYVNDIIVIGSNNNVIKKLIVDINYQFSLKDLHDLKLFLGIEIRRSSKGMLLTQTKYICDMLNKTKMDGAQVSPSPMALSKSLYLQEGDIMHNLELYRSIVNALQYLTINA